MEGLSESAWQESDSSMGLNTSILLDRNLGLLQDIRIGFVGDESHDPAFSKDQDQAVLASLNNIKNQELSMWDCEEVTAVAADPFLRALEWNDISLREWSDKPECNVDEFGCLHIFRQIVEIVNLAHSQGAVVQNIWPSCFVMSPFDQVIVMESSSCSDSGYNSQEEGLNSQTETKDETHLLPDKLHQQRSSPGIDNFLLVGSSINTSSSTSCMQSSSMHATQASSVEAARSNGVEQGEGKTQAFLMKLVLLMETFWYTSPEELAGAPSSCASDIYCLGVLL